jgi:phospholipid/cholesterol/gamma-HCH transport system ATP-binding protein
MKKRVGIARALIGKPRLIFYDEPTAGLDPLTSRSIVGLVGELHAKHRTTDVVVTHDLEIAKNVADRIAVINRGEIQALGTWRELLESDHPFVQKFFQAGGFYEEIFGQS